MVEQKVTNLYELLYVLTNRTIGDELVYFSSGPVASQTQLYEGAKAYSIETVPVPPRIPFTADDGGYKEITVYEPVEVIVRFPNRKDESK